MINLSNNYLMMIEPKNKSGDRAALLSFKSVSLLAHCEVVGITKGFHICICGEMSDNKEYKTPLGRITNSLLPHYLFCHANEIPESELIKLKEELDYMRQ